MLLPENSLSRSHGKQMQKEHEMQGNKVQGTSGDFCSGILTLVCSLFKQHKQHRAELCSIMQELW